MLASIVIVCVLLFQNVVRDVHDYFRAVVKADERSERVLELTATALSYNAANYSVWWV